jgi:general stress protein YciG
MKYRHAAVATATAAQACGALGNLAYDTDHKIRAGRAGGVTAVIAVLKRPGVDAQNPLATKALGALRNLAFDAENACEAVREGGIQVSPPRTHAQEQARRHTRTTSFLPRPLFHPALACPLLFPRPLPSNFLRLLCSFTAVDRPQALVAPPCAPAYPPPFSPQLALKFIGQYGATDELQEAACGAISNMAAPEPEYRQLAAKEGLYPAVTKILLRPRVLPDGLRGAACGALAVAAAEPGPERSAAADDLAKSAAECLARPGASESLALAALAVIRGMAGAAAAAIDGGGVRAAAVRGGGVGAAVRALWRRSASAGLLTAGNGAVNALMKDPEGPAAAVRDGAAAGLAAAMKRDVVTPELRLALCKTLKAVLDATPAGAGPAGVGSSGIRESLALAKGDAASSPELQSLAEACIKALPPPTQDFSAAE